MSNYAVVDTDILLKFSAWKLGDELVSFLRNFGGGATLELTYLIAHKQLRKNTAISDLEIATTELTMILGQLRSIEPSSIEAVFAAEMEDVATREGLPFDRGESQLLSIVLLRNLPALATGDKRATAAVSTVLDLVGKADLCRECIICLEQIVMAAIKVKGIEATHASVCREPELDKTISICFRCGQTHNIDQTLEGLTSYIEDLRGRSNGAVLALI